MPPLLTHIMAGRNDNYLGNFKRRLELAVNYICANVEKAGRQDDYELLICDWNSPSPLRSALNLNEAARRLTSFLEVPPPLVAKHGFDGVVFHPAASVNVAFRRARGRLIMLSPADALFPLQSVKNLFDLLEGRSGSPIDIDRCYLGIMRYLIPWQASERLRLEDLDRYFLLHANLANGVTQPNGSNLHGLAAGEAAQIVSSYLLRQITGLDESMANWGGQELEMARRIGQFAPIVRSLLGGVFAYDLQQRPRARAGQLGNVERVNPSQQVNDENWGLGDEDIPFQPALARPGVDNQTEAAEIFDQASLLGLKPARKSRLAGGLGRLVASARQEPEKAAGFFFGLAGRPKKRPWFSRVGFEILTARLGAEPGPEWGDAPLKNDMVGVDRPGTDLRCPQSFFGFDPQWFGPANKIQAYLHLALERGAHRLISRWSTGQAHSFLAVLAAVARQRPCRFFWAGLRDFYLAQAAVAVDPTLELCGYDHWRTDLPGPHHRPGHLYPINAISVALEEVDFRGHLHILTGPPEDAFERLRAMELIGDPFQGAFLDLDFLSIMGDDLGQRTSPLWDSSCVLVVRGQAEARAVWARSMPGQGFRQVGRLPDIEIFQRGDS